MHEPHDERHPPSQGHELTISGTVVAARRIDQRACAEQSPSRSTSLDQHSRAEQSPVEVDEHSSARQCNPAPVWNSEGMRSTRQVHVLREGVVVAELDATGTGSRLLASAFSFSYSGPRIEICFGGEFFTTAPRTSRAPTAPPPSGA